MQVIPNPCIENQWATSAFHSALDDACKLPIEKITPADMAKLKQAYLSMWLDCAWPAGNC